MTNTLGNPDEEKEYIPQILKPLADSRLQANAIKRAEPITVVIGNPPYKEKARGKGGWIETGSVNTNAPLDRWIPPPQWGVSAHAKHLRNFYIYFWRWATWKVFGDGATAPQAAPNRKGIVCFITVAGFLNGPSFQAMRSDMRRTGNEIWIIDCSPEGHQPAVSSRIFQGVQHPVCIVLAARMANNNPDKPARVRFRSLPPGDRDDKFAALAALTLDGDGWADCSEDWRAPFLPNPTGGWATFPKLSDLFIYDGSGVQPARMWIIAPDRESLARRWERIRSETNLETKEFLFHPHFRGGHLGDRYLAKIVQEGLYGQEKRSVSVANDAGTMVKPFRYGFRSFNRQWIIPDNRLINQPNPTLWSIWSEKQLFLTALTRAAPTSGPALTFTALIPDYDHYRGSFGGRVFPLWMDAAAEMPNIRSEMMTRLTDVYGTIVSPADVMAYIAAIAAHPAYVSRFAPDLVQPGLRIPITADALLFGEALVLGREVIWLHTFGDRFVSPSEGRPASAPRLPEGQRPQILTGGSIPSAADAMPDTISYDLAARRLHIGSGFVDNVPPQVWSYEVSGKNVLTQWFSYRSRDDAAPLLVTGGLRRH